MGLLSLTVGKNKCGKGVPEDHSDLFVRGASEFFVNAVLKNPNHKSSEDEKHTGSYPKVHCQRFHEYPSILPLVFFSWNYH